MANFFDQADGSQGAPAPAANPNFFDQVDGQPQGAPNAPPQASSAASPVQGSGDIMLQHLAHLFHAADLVRGGADIYAKGTPSFDDAMRVAANTLLPADRFASAMSGLTGIGGGDYAAQQAETEAASARLPWTARDAATMVGYAPFGELGIARAAGGGIGGSALEGATGNAIAGALKDKDPVRGAVGGGLIGGLVGGATGIAGELADWATRRIANPVGRWAGILAEPAEVTSATSGAKEAAYDAANKFGFTPSQVNPAYQTAYTLPEDQFRNLTPGFLEKVQQHINANQLMKSISAGNIDGFARDLQEAASSNADTVAAAKIKANLENVMQNAKPATGQDPGAAWDAITNARKAFQASQMAVNLEKWSQNLRDQYINPGPEIQSQAQQFYKPGTPEWDVMSSLVRRSGGGGLTAQGAVHLAEPLFEGGGAALGGPAGAAVGGAAAQVMKPTLGGWLDIMKRGGIQNELAQAYPTMTAYPGRPQGFQTSYAPDWAQALRYLTLGKSAQAAGGF